LLRRWHRFCLHGGCFHGCCFYCRYLATAVDVVLWTTILLPIVLFPTSTTTTTTMTRPQGPLLHRSHAREVAAASLGGGSSQGERADGKPQEIRVARQIRKGANRKTSKSGKAKNNPQVDKKKYPTSSPTSSPHSPSYSLTHHHTHHHTYSLTTTLPFPSPFPDHLLIESATLTSLNRGWTLRSASKTSCSCATKWWSSCRSKSQGCTS
jgi:hypothetical protein